MVKHRRRRRTRWGIAAAVVTVVAAAGLAVLLAGGSGGHPAARAPSPPAPPQSTAPGPSPSTPAPSTPTASPPSPATTAAPLGPAGHWKLVFDDEFNGTSLNTTVWNPHDGWTNQNGVTDSAANVAVRGGDAVLTLASAQSGAEIGTWGVGLGVGQFLEARIAFPGHGATVDNWPAFWTSGPNWPAGGENDVAEGFGALTVNYHSPTVVHLTGQVPGHWAGGFHVYGIYRGRTAARVYWDGRLVRTYATADDGDPQTILLTLGAGDHVVTGPAGQMRVDYVRMWAPA